MCGFLPSVLVDVGVPGAPPVEHFFRQKQWLIMTPAPLRFWPRIVASASTTTSVVVVLLPWSIVVVVVGLESRTLLLPYLPHPRLRSGFGILSSKS
jgi:hypothetical protein